MNSNNIKIGVERAPNRSLLYALGYTDEEIRKPLIGVVSSYNEIVPGHMNLDKITEAVKAVGISRSEYYKYRDSVEVYTREYQDNIITLQAVLTDRAGVLSSFLNAVARAGGNVLTVNQNIPIDGAAGITLSVNTADMRLKIETLMKRLLALDGVQSAQILQGRR